MLDEKSLPDCPINQTLRDELSELSNDELWEKLNSLDNVRASLIHPNNKDKVIRSIEMCLELGEPISQYKRKDNEKFDSAWYMPSFPHIVYSFSY